jgi:hypothetical protein
MSERTTGSERHDQPSERRPRSERLKPENELPRKAPPVPGLPLLVAREASPALTVPGAGQMDTTPPTGS